MPFDIESALKETAQEGEAQKPGYDIEAALAATRPPSFAENIGAGLKKGALDVAGVVEGALSTAGSAAAYPAASLAGLGKGIAELATSGKFRGYEQTRNEIAQALTHEPVIPMGQRTSEVLSSLFQIAGTGIEALLSGVPPEKRDQYALAIDLGMLGMRPKAAPLKKIGKGKKPVKPVQETVPPEAPPPIAEPPIEAIRPKSPTGFTIEELQRLAPQEEAPIQGLRPVEEPTATTEAPVPEPIPESIATLPGVEAIMGPETTPELTFEKRPVQPEPAREQLRQAPPKSILDMIKKYGGINYVREGAQKGEIRQLIENNPQLQFLVNKKGKGLSLDDMAQRAVEHGFIPERDINQLIDAINQRKASSEVMEQAGENQAEKLSVARGEERDLGDYVTRNSLKPGDKINVRYRDTKGGLISDTLIVGETDAQGNMRLTDGIDIALDPFEDNRMVILGHEKGEGMAPAPAAEEPFFAPPAEAIEKPRKASQADMFGARTGLEGPLPSTEMKGETPLEIAAQEERTRRAQAGQQSFASVGEHAPIPEGPYAPAPLAGIEMPEAVEILRELTGKYPRIKERLRSSLGEALGKAYPETGTVELLADLAKNPDIALRVFQHEIGHILDYSGLETMKHGNILGKMASLRDYTRHMLESFPGGPDILTASDKARIRRQAEAEARGQAAPVKITPEEITSVWNDVEARAQDKELFDWVASLEGKKKAELVKAAIKGIIPDWVDFRRSWEALPGDTKKIFARMLAEEVKKRGLYERDTILNELKGLTQEIKPFDEERDPRYTEYRYSNEELYADAAGTLMGSPEFMRSRAPEFYRGFLSYLENKPAFKKVYEEVQARMKDREAILKAREERVVSGYEKGWEERRKAIEEAREEDTFSDAWKQAKRALWDINSEIIEIQTKLEKMGVRFHDKPTDLLEEWGMVNAPVLQYIRDMEAGVFRELEKAGITLEDAGQFAQYRRAVSERGEMFNPLGMGGAAAIEQMAYLNRKYGQSGMVKLTEIMDAFFRNREAILNEIDAAKMLSPELMEKLRSNTEYVTFNTMAEIDKLYGAGTGAKIFPQIGTQKGLAHNPITETILKDISLLRAAKKTQAAKAVIGMARIAADNGLPIEIIPARMTFNGKVNVPQRINNQKYGTIMVMEEGKLRGYYTSRYIADSFNLDPFDTGAIMGYIAKASRPVKAVLVSKNPFFFLWNTLWMRDPMSWAKQMPKGSLSKAYWYAGKSIKDAYMDVVKRESTPLVRKLYENGALQPDLSYAALDLSQAKQIDVILQKAGLEPKKYQHQVLKPFIKLGNAASHVIQIGERVYKIGGAKYLYDLQKKGISPYMTDKSIAHAVRTLAGSPNFRRAGSAVQFYNNLILFSNAGKEGMRAGIEAYKTDPGGYIYRTFKYSVLPTMIKYAAFVGLVDAIFQKAGIIGEDKEPVKEMMGKINQNDLMRYNVMPFGFTEKNEAMYMVQPQDFNGQVLSSLLWEGLMAAHKEQSPAETVNKLSTLLFEATPYTSVNPWIELLGDTGKYIMGKPIIDSWSGQEVISKEAMQARRVDEMKAAKPFLRHVWNKMGGGAIFYQWPVSDLQQTQSELGKVLKTPVIGLGIKRFIRVSDQGETQRINQKLDRIRSERASENIDIRKAIIENMESDAPLPAGALYSKLLSEGIVQRKKYSIFAKQYRDMRLMKDNGAIMRVWIGATTEEKEEILRNFNPSEVRQ